MAGKRALIGNMEGQGGEHFVDMVGGDLPSTLGWVEDDSGGDIRDAAPDVGADER